MVQENEYGKKLRVLRVLIMLMERPFGYTLKQLATRTGVSTGTVKKDIKAIREGGFEVSCDKKYCYGFEVDRRYNDLKDLLEFSEKDQLLLLNALDTVSNDSKQAEKLKRKLASMYDYTRIGRTTLRKPYLTKVDLLTRAKKEKKQIILLDYRSSNSNEISDRRVEGFDPNIHDDVLQAFDVDKKKLRHFRISRITRLRITDDPWQYEKKHEVIATDPFRIVEKKQVMVHLRLKVGAYNELVERFPLTQSYITPDAVEEGIYDFQCAVNHNFIGLTNFILGFHHQLVEVIEPELLLAHLRTEVKKMNF